MLSAIQRMDPEGRAITRLRNILQPIDPTQVPTSLARNGFFWHITQSHTEIEHLN